MTISEYSDFTLKVTNRFFNDINMAKEAMGKEFAAKNAILHLTDKLAAGAAQVSISDLRIEAQVDTDMYAWTVLEAVPEDGDDKSSDIQVCLNLLRRRDCENEEWSDNIYLKLDKDRYNAGTLDLLVLLRSVIQDWLKTPEGWAANQRSSLDFNWGDFINDFPMGWKYNGVTVSTSQDRSLPLETVTGALVNQDELLAPTCVDAIVENDTGDKECACIDMTTGDLYNLSEKFCQSPCDNHMLKVYIGNFAFSAVFNASRDCWTLT